MITGSLTKNKIKLLNNVIKSIYEKNNSFYIEKFFQSGYTQPFEIKSTSDFLSILPTSKKELCLNQRHNPPYGTNCDCSKDNYFFVMSTNGTTAGEKLLLPLSKHDYQGYVNELHFSDSLLGIQSTDVFAYLSGILAVGHINKVEQYGGRFIPLSGSYTDIIDQLKVHKVTVLKSSPTVFRRLIVEAERNSIDLKKLFLRKIITIGESGGESKEFQKFIKKHMKVAIQSEYGMSEQPTIAVTCLKHSNYFLNDAQTILEVNAIDNSGFGELFITALWRKDFPLIRYRTGDIVQIQKKSCNCHSGKVSIGSGVVGRLGNRISINGKMVYPSEIISILERFTSQNFEIWLSKMGTEEKIDVYIELLDASDLQKMPSLSEALSELIGGQSVMHPLPPQFIDVQKIKHKSIRFFDARIDKKNPPYKRRKIISTVYTIMGHGKNLLKKVI